MDEGVTQGSVHGQLLYVIFTVNIPTNLNTTMATFADDTAILSCSDDPVSAAF